MWKWLKDSVKYSLFLSQWSRVNSEWFRPQINMEHHLTIRRLRSTDNLDWSKVGPKVHSAQTFLGRYLCGLTGRNILELILPIPFIPPPRKSPKLTSKDNAWCSESHNRRRKHLIFRTSMLHSSFRGTRKSRGHKNIISLILRVHRFCFIRSLFLWDMLYCYTLLL